MVKVKKKQTREERLEKKRQAEKLRYQRIKNDPGKNAQLKEKENQQYKKKKEKGQIKSIKDMSEREQRAIRKIWRDKTKKHRDRVKLQFTRNNPITPPASDNEDQPPLPQNNIALAAKRRSEIQRKLRNKLEIKQLRQKKKEKNLQDVIIKTTESGKRTSVESLELGVNVKIETYDEDCQIEEVPTEIIELDDSNDEHDDNRHDSNDKLNEIKDNFNDETIKITEDDFKQKTVNITFYEVDPDIVLKDASRINIENIADQKLKIEIRNCWGRVRHVEHVNSKHESLVQAALGKWELWIVDNIHRNTPLMYKCYICNLAWWDLHNFNEHIRIHNEGLNVDLETVYHECNIIAFKGSKPASSEIKIHDRCRKCGCKSEFHSLKNRMTGVYYKCESCNRGFQTCLALFQHQGKCMLNKKKMSYNCNPKTLNNCSICNLHIVTQKLLKYHYTFYHQVRSDMPILNPLVDCLSCPRSFISLSSHICPNRTWSARCDSCCRRFASKMELNIHTRSNISFYCKICSKVYQNKCSEIKHYVNHSNNFVVQYKCVLCSGNIVFVNAESMQGHWDAKHKSFHCVTMFMEMVLVGKSTFKDCQKNLKTIKIQTVKNYELNNKSKQKILLSSKSTGSTNNNNSGVSGLSKKTNKFINENNQTPIKIEIVSDSEDEDCGKFLDDEIMNDTMNINECISNQYMNITRNKSNSLDAVSVKEENDRLDAERELEIEILDETKYINEVLAGIKNNSLSINDATNYNESSVNCDVNYKENKNQIDELNEVLVHDEINIKEEPIEPNMLLSVGVVSNTAIKTEIMSNDDKLNQTEDMINNDEQNCNLVVSCEAVKDMINNDEQNCNLVVSCEAVNVKQENEFQCADTSVTVCKVEPVSDNEFDHNKTPSTSFIYPDDCDIDEEDLEDDIIVLDTNFQHAMINTIKQNENEKNNINDEKSNGNDDDDDTKSLSYIKHQETKEKIRKLKLKLKKFNEMLKRPIEKNKFIIGKKKPMKSDIDSVTVKNYNVKSEISDSVSSKKNKKECNICGFVGSVYKYKIHADSCLNPYTCSKCDQTYETMTEYVAHFSEHGYKREMCPHCSKKFKTFRDLVVHFTVQLRISYSKLTEYKDSYRCSLCETNVTKDLLFTHWEEHLPFHEDADDSLDEDDDELNDIDNDENSQQSDNENERSDDLQNTSDGRLSPKIVFTIVSTLLKKKKKNHQDRSCVLCKKIFMRQGDLKRHLVEHLLSDARLTYEEFNGFKCHVCDEILSDVKNYKQHMRVHANLPIFQCHVCSNISSDSSNYAKHKKLHSNLLPTCKICNKKFHTKRMLDQHLQMHKNTPPMRCLCCDILFYCPTTYKRHVRGTHAKSLHTCSICTLKFDTSKERAIHMWEIHKKSKANKRCSVCDLTFRNLMSARKHMSEAHGIEREPR